MSEDMITDLRKLIKEVETEISSLPTETYNGAVGVIFANARLTGYITGLLNAYESDNKREES